MSILSIFQTDGPGEAAGRDPERCPAGAGGASVSPRSRGRKEKDKTFLAVVCSGAAVLLILLL